MSNWAELAKGVREACTDTWGVQATFRPPNGLPVSIDGVFETPALFEDVLPGSTDGVSVIRFWVDSATISPQPARGNVITIQGIDYDIVDVQAKPEGSGDGGSTLKLRKRS